MEDKIFLPKDHSFIVKFDTPVDQGYRSARERLKEFEKEALPVVSARFGMYNLSHSQVFVS